jgi:hypothetical protein
VPDDKQAAVLGASFGELERPFQAARLDAGDIADLGRVAQCPPAAVAVGRWEIPVGTGRRYECQNRYDERNNRGEGSGTDGLHDVG